MKEEDNSSITDEQLDVMLKNLTETDESFTTKELKQKIKDQEIYITGLKYKIQRLENELENFLSIQRQNCYKCRQKASIDYADVENLEQIEKNKAQANKDIHRAYLFYEQALEVCLGLLSTLENEILEQRADDGMKIDAFTEHLLKIIHGENN